MTGRPEIGREGGKSLKSFCLPLINFQARIHLAARISSPVQTHRAAQSR